MKYVNTNKIKELMKRGKILLLPIVLSTTMVTGCSSEEYAVKQAKEMGCELSEVDTDLYDNPEKFYFIEANDTDLFQKYSKLSSVEDFGQYTGESNITWSDIKNTLNNNSNLDDTIRNILLKGINNLEKSDLSIKLEVLNYNLKNMKLEYFEEQNNIITHVGQFDGETCIASFNKSCLGTTKFETVVIHEILGHGMNIAYIPEQGILCSPKVFALHLNKNYINSKQVLSNGLFSLGDSFNEAIAEMITVAATNQKLENDMNTYYDVFVQELSFLLKSSDIALSDYANKGLIYLCEQMKSKGCENPLNVVFDFDVKKSLYDNGQYINNINGVNPLETTELNYLKEIVDYKVNQNIDNDSIMEFVNSSIDSYKDYIKPEIIDGNKTVTWYTDYESESINFDNMKQAMSNMINNSKTK